MANFISRSVFSLSLLNALTFALGLFFIRKIKFDDTVKTLRTVKEHFSIKDFLKDETCIYAYARATFAKNSLVVSGK